MMEVQKEATKVRPKLLQLVASDIQQNLCAQNVGVAGERMGTRMVEVGGARGQSVTEEFGEVELRFSRRVRSRDDHPPGGVGGAMKKIAFSHLVVARVLTKQSGEYGARPEVSDDGVRIRRAEAFGITNKPLTVGGVRIVSLTDARFDADKHGFDGVEATLRHRLELFPGRERG